MSFLLKRQGLLSQKEGPKSPVIFSKCKITDFLTYQTSSPTEYSHFQQECTVINRERQVEYTNQTIKATVGTF